MEKILPQTTSKERITMSGKDTPQNPPTKQTINKNISKLHQKNKNRHIKPHT